MFLRLVILPRTMILLKDKQMIRTRMCSMMTTIPQWEQATCALLVSRNQKSYSKSPLQKTIELTNEKGNQTKTRKHKMRMPWEQLKNKSNRSKFEEMRRFVMAENKQASNQPQNSNYYFSIQISVNSQWDYYYTTISLLLQNNTYI